MKEFIFKYMIFTLILLGVNFTGQSQVVDNKGQAAKETQIRPKSVQDVRTLNKVLEHRQIFDDRIVVTKYSTDPAKEPEVTIIWKNK